MSDTAARTGIPAPAILTPWADTLLVGGAFVVLFAAWAVFDFDLTSQNALQRFYFLNFLINAPHFMASYKLLYGAPDMRRTYPGVTWWLPGVLALWAVTGLALYGQSRVFLEAMFGAAAVSLSWHYTNQTWGMMASFAHIHGLGFTDRERRLVRANLDALLGFHVAWAVIISRRIFEPAAAGVPLLSAQQAEWLYRLAAAVAAASSVLGVAGLLLWVRRAGRVPPVRVWLPWVTVHLWYVLIYLEPGALFWAQNAHALQYLMFPLRTEMNRTAAAGRAVSPWRMLRWYVYTAALGLLVLLALPWLAKNKGGALGLPGLPLDLTIVSFVNLHHYFVDGVIWKIRNRAVRRDMFAHLARTNPAVPPAAVTAAPGPQPSTA